MFDGQVKLIKYDYAGESTLGTAPASNGTLSSSYYKGSLSRIPYYYWSGSSSNDSNTWSSSTLNTDILNGTYLNTLGSEWSSLIATTSWKVGGMAWSSTNTAKQYYTTELGSSSSSTTYNAKVGLMYVSEYGYAASPENWNTPLNNYANDTNRNNNWLYMGYPNGQFPAVRMALTVCSLWMSLVVWFTATCSSAMGSGHLLVLNLA